MAEKRIKIDKIKKTIIKKAPPKQATKKPVKKIPNPYSLKLGARIRELRKAMGYTNADHFSYDHSISRSQFSRWETAVDDIRFSSLMRLIEIFKITPSEFFKGF